MTSYNQPSEVQGRSDEISIRELVLKLISYVLLIFRKWYFVLLGAVLLGSYFYYSYQGVVKTYPASIKIFVNPAQINDSNKELVEVFSRLLNTQRMLLNVLLEPISVEDEENVLINLYLKTYFAHNPSGLPESIPSNFQFRNNSMDSMDVLERQVLQDIITKVNTPVNTFSDGFVSVSGDFKLGFVTINVSSPSEELSMLLLDKLNEEVRFVFLDNILNANNVAFSNLESETDSLAKKYKVEFLQLNKYRDKRQRLLASLKESKSKDKGASREVRYLEKKIHKLSADADISKTSYLAALELQKIAQLEKDQNVVNIQELERTFTPITPYQPSPMVFGIRGSIYGALCAIGLLIFVSLVLDFKKELYRPVKEI